MLYPENILDKYAEVPWYVKMPRSVISDVDEIVANDFVKWFRMPKIIGILLLYTIGNYFSPKVCV